MPTRYVPPPPKLAMGSPAPQPGIPMGEIAPLPTENKLIAPPKATIPAPPVAPPTGQILVAQQPPQQQTAGLFDEFLPQAQPAPQASQFAKPGPYATQLSPTDEANFQQWVKLGGIPFDASPTSDYDMRGYWKDVASKGNDQRQTSEFDGKPHFPDTYKTPYHKTFSRESKYATPDAPAWQGNKLIDKNGQVIADETPSAGLFDEFLPTAQAPQRDDAPGQIVMDAASHQPVSPQQAAATSAGQAIPAAAKPAPKKLTKTDKVLQQVGAGIQEGIAQGKKKFPLLGEAYQTAIDIPIGIGAFWNTMQQRGLPAAMGGLAAGFAPGFVGFPQDLLNLSNQKHREQQKAPLGANQATIEKAFSLPLQPLMGSIDYATKTANKLLGRGENKPVRVREELKKAPGVEAAYSDPTLAPATGMGEILGGLGAGLLAPELGIPVKLAGKPMISAIGAGAVNAPLYGAVSDLGQQSQEQQQKGEQKPLDYGKAAITGVKSIPGGALTGGIVHVAGKGAQAVVNKFKKPVAQTEAAGGTSHENIQLDGQEVSRQAAMSILDDPHATPEAKQKILDALNTADQVLATGQQASSAAAKPEIKSQVIPPPTREQAAFEASKGPIQQPIGEGLGFDHIKDYNQGQWIGPQQVSTAGPKDPNAVNQGLWTGSQPSEAAPAPVGGENQPAKYNNPFMTPEGKPGQMTLAEYQARSAEAIKNAADIPTLDQAYNDAEAWAGRNVKGTLKKPYQQELVRLRGQREFELREQEREANRARQQAELEEQQRISAENNKTAAEYLKENGFKQSLTSLAPGDFYDGGRPNAPNHIRLNNSFGSAASQIELSNRLVDLSPEQKAMLDQLIQQRKDQTAPFDEFLSNPEPAPAPQPEEPPPVTAYTPAEKVHGDSSVGDVTEINQPRYVVEASPDKKYNYNLVDTTTGEVLRTNKDRKQLEKTAEKANSGGQLGQGKKVVETPLNKGVVESGQPLPEDFPADQRSAYDAVGMWKAAHDATRARLEGIAQALFDMTGGKMPKEKVRLFNAKSEAARATAREARPEDFSIEVNAEDRPAPDMNGLEGMTLDQLKQLYDKTWDEFKESQESLKTAKSGLTLPHDSVTWETGGKRYNARPTAKPGTPSAAELPPMETGKLEENGRTYQHVQKSIKQAVIPGNSVYSAAANSTNGANLGNGKSSLLNVVGKAASKAEDIITKVVSDFVSEEHGHGETQYGIDLVTLGTGRAIASSLAEGAAKHGGIRNIVEHGGQAVSNLLTLRRTFDFIHDYSAQLHNKIWENVAKETIVGRGIKFEPHEMAILDQSIGMTPEAIRKGENGLHNLPAKKRDYLATRRTVRQESARMVREEMQAMETQYGNRAAMPPKVRDQYDAMKSFEEGITGRTPAGNPLDAALRMGNDIMYDYLFKWNPAYHALNLTDPLVVGSSRVGLNRVLAGKAAVNPMLGDSKVRQYIAEIADAMENPMKNNQGGGGLLNAIPDMPSVAWNNRDMLAAGLMMHADKIGYKGGGNKFLSDLANGKLSIDQQVKAMVDALQVNNDVNGAGTFGLDKDMVARSNFGRAVLQFTSQPMRVTRLLSQYVRNGQIGSLMTFLTVQTLLSGSGVIPKDVEQLWASIDTDSLKATQDQLNKLNVLENIAGRSVTDKLRWAILPALSGSHSNIAGETLGDIAEILNDARDGQVEDRHQKQGISLVASILAGGGGNTAQRFWKELEAGAAGEKEEKAYGDDFVRHEGIPRPLDKRTVPYSMGQALVNATLPGKPAETAQWERGARQKAQAKNLLKLKGKK